MEEAGGGAAEPEADIPYMGCGGSACRDTNRRLKLKTERKRRAAHGAPQYCWERFGVQTEEQKGMQPPCSGDPKDEE